MSIDINDIKTDNRLPRDLVQIALWVVRGYSRREDQYIILRDAIEKGSRIKPYQNNIVKRRTNAPYDPTSNSVEQLETLDASPDSFALKVVDDGLDLVTRDFPKGERERIQDAIYRNCLSGKKYPYGYTKIAVSYREFYRRRYRFLYYILDTLGYIDRLFVG